MWGARAKHLLGLAVATITVLGAGAASAHSPHPGKVKRGDCVVKMKQPAINFQGSNHYYPLGRARIRAGGCADNRVTVFLGLSGGGSQWTLCCGAAYVGSPNEPVSALSNSELQSCDGKRRYGTVVRIGSCGACDDGTPHRFDQSRSVIC